MDRIVLCPICRQPRDEALLAIQPKIEDHIAHILKEDHPGWKPQKGA